MRRKYLTLIMAGIMAVSLTACGGAGEGETAETTAVTETEGLSGEETEAAADTEVTEDTEAETPDGDAAEDKTEVASQGLSGEETEETETELDENGVHLGDYSGFTYVRDYTAPTEEELEETIQDILDSNAEPVYVSDGTVEEGDTIIVTFTGTVDGEELEGLSGEEEEFTVGSGEFLEEFESQMVGRDAGEEFQFTIDFPEDYAEADVAGKTAEFTAVIESILSDPGEVELTDEWVRENSDYETVDEYRATIMEDLEDQANEYADSVAIYGLLSDLYNVSYAEYTDEELEAAIEEQRAIYEDAASVQGITYEEYVEEYMADAMAISAAEGETEEETEGETGDVLDRFEEYLKNIAEEELEREKILTSFCEKEGVDISDEAYEDYLAQEAEMYGYESADEFLEELDSVGYNEEIHDIFIEVQAGRRLMELSEEVVPEVAEPETTETETDEISSEAETSIQEEVETEEGTETDTEANAETEGLEENTETETE